MSDKNKRTLLSIVIANYNYGRFLEDAIKSVVDQCDSPVVDEEGRVVLPIKGCAGATIELIICDAASTDNSVEIIKKYAGGLPSNAYRLMTNDQCTMTNDSRITWWCSEKDGGQSAAFNKGFGHGKGEWLTWLNADDLLLPGTLAAFARLIARKPKAQWVTGNKISFDSDSGNITQVNWGPHWQVPFLKGRRAFSTVFGPTTFWKRSVYEKLGPIDENLHYAMDTEYWARITMAGVRQTRLCHLCWGFRNHESSKTAGVQSNEVCVKRIHETMYWKQKIGYDFRVSVTNLYYIMWVLWRILDCSWLVRLWLKFYYEGKQLISLI